MTGSVTDPDGIYDDVPEVDDAEPADAQVEHLHHVGPDDDLDDEEGGP